MGKQKEKGGLVKTKMEQQSSSNGRIRYVLRSRVVDAVSTSKRSFDAYLSRLIKENNPEAGSFIMLTPEQVASRAKPKTTKALDFYNEKWGKNYELVDPGDVSSHLISRGCVHHVNFQAKSKDESDAPLEMFFAELLSSGYMKLSVELCVSLGPLNLLSEERKLHGCFMCYKDTIYHPATKGFRNGR